MYQMGRVVPDETNILDRFGSLSEQQKLGRRQPLALLLAAVHVVLLRPDDVGLPAADRKPQQLLLSAVANVAVLSSAAEGGPKLLFLSTAADVVLLSPASVV